MSDTIRSEPGVGAVFLIPLLAFGLVGCERQPEEAGRAIPPAAETAPPAAGTVPPGGTATALAPGEITGILVASDSAEIKPSQLAQERAEHPDVRAFADRMIEDHGMLEDSIRVLSQRQNITSQPTNISQQLESETRSTVQRLEGLSGSEFDRAYIQAMVKSHQDALNLVDQQLLPGTQDPELRQEIERQVRPVIAAHLEVARQLEQTLVR